MLYLLLNIVHVVQSLNYTTIQERIVGNNVGLFKVFGKVERKSTLDRWSYPASSTEDLKRLFVAEEHRISALKIILSDIEKITNKLRSHGDGHILPETFKDLKFI